MSVPTNLESAIKEINLLRSLLIPIAFPKIGSIEEKVNIADIARWINEQVHLHDLLPTRVLLESEFDEKPTADSIGRKIRPKFISHKLGPTDIEPGSWEEEFEVRSRSREASMESNSDYYRRSQSTARARKKRCQNCNCVPTPRPADVIGRIRSGINVHHLKPITSGGAVSDGLVALCDKCHIEVHTIDGRLDWRNVNEDLTEQLKSVATYL